MTRFLKSRVVLVGLAALVSIQCAAENTFRGKISVYEAQSEPYWPPQTSAPQGAPNVIIWLLDDVGFGQLGAFGGVIDTPTIDSLAQHGLSYTNFHSTSLCSPSRASLLTGRNHHAVGMGMHAIAPSGYPGYYGRVPRSAGSIARILRDAGYSTYMAGKWDQLPVEHSSIVGPFDQWPDGQGFEHFYGFVAGDTNQFVPSMWSGHEPVEVGGRGYHVSTDIADKAITWVTAQKSAAPEKPFFLYWATGAVHAPHQAPRAYLEKYRGKFDGGWDQLRETVLRRQKKLGVIPADTRLGERPGELPAWDSLTRVEQKIASRQMEAFAAQLDHADHEFGRIIQVLRETGQLDNTLIFVTSDNGASAEGGPAGSYNEKRNLAGFLSTPDINSRFTEGWGGQDVFGHYSAAWALAGNTPFNFYKQTTRGGGVNSPLVVSWPDRINGGQLRRQFHHINDITPTILELVGIEAPAQIDGIEQQRFDGVSLAYSFDNVNAPSRHNVQYFEMGGNRAIYADGWKAVATSRPVPWAFKHGNLDPQSTPWELYHVAVDVNETVNLAETHAVKLAELQRLFDQEARRNNVYPLAPNAFEHWQEKENSLLASRNNRFEFYPPGAFRMPYTIVAPTYSYSYRLTAHVEASKEGGDGVIAAQGGRDGGFVLFLDKGKPVYSHSYFGEEVFRVEADRRLGAGPATIGVSVMRNDSGGANVTMYLANEQVAERTLPRVQPAVIPLDEVFDIGRDSGSTVSADAAANKPLVDAIRKVTIDILAGSKTNGQ